MKRLVLLSLAVFFCFATTVASAASNGDKYGENHRIPVLVNVNAKGEVTRVDPAYKLRPSMQRVLRDTLEKMITKPALKEGKPVASQFVVNLALVATPKGNGTYGVAFKYISSQSLPAGSWYWVHAQYTHQLALADQSSSTIMPASVKTPVQSLVDKLNQAAQKDNGH